MPAEQVCDARSQALRPALHFVFRLASALQIRPSATSDTDSRSPLTHSVPLRRCPQGTNLPRDQLLRRDSRMPRSVTHRHLGMFSRLALAVIQAAVLGAITLQAETQEISGLANSHPDYLALRNAGLDQSFSVRDLTLVRDVGTIRLAEGTVTFLDPVLESTPIAVFRGSGEFTLDPATIMEENIIDLYTNTKSVKEAFDEAVLCFTDDTAAEIRNSGSPTSDAQAAAILKRFRERMRNRSDKPQSMMEAMLKSSYMANIEANILAGLLNRDRPGFFSAYIKGNRFSDLRFHVRPFGAVPQVLSPEEVGLINYNPTGFREGIWYLSHFKSEHDSNSASSHEDKRIIDVAHYDIDASISKNRDLSATAVISFRALRPGTRVIRFRLVPTLRVSEVTFQDAPTHFVQTRKREDPGFYVILPEPLTKGLGYRISVRYSGDEVVRKAGGGNFYVGSRTSWYPSIGSFRDRSTFDIGFRHPRNYVLISVGDRIEEYKDGTHAYSRWKSDVPLKIAGFNLGVFKSTSREDERTSMVVESFATRRPPDFLQRGAARAALPGSTRSTRAPLQMVMSPTRMMENAVAQSQASLQIFTHWFGSLPHKRLALTQQPQFGFGQSWPTLIYLPVSAFLDDTQRWSILGQNAFDFAEFVQKVTPHEVAHQWWGHLVGWATYHDQWISEGFSDFSAGLYLQATGQHKEYLKFLRRWREMILEKNKFGMSANDVGPLWMGQRLITSKSEAAFRKLIYPKGGFVLHMLRQLMYDQRNGGDQAFIKMMRDFVATHHNKDASTESFKYVVEQHMTPAMDLAGNGTMDWFFHQWIYGSEVPSYEFEYSLEETNEGKAHIQGKLTQVGVSDTFVTSIPMYVRYQGNLIRIGSGKMVGSDSSLDLDLTLPIMPEELVPNAFHDVLAQEVKIKRR